MVEQLARQHDPRGNVELTLRRSTRVRRSVIPDDYIMYFQELDNDLRAENDPNNVFTCHELQRI